MGKDMDSIVNELVEKRLNDKIRDYVYRIDEGYGDDEMESAFKEKIKSIILSEVEKIDGEIRKLVVDALKKTVGGTKLTVSAEVTTPRGY